MHHRSAFHRNGNSCPPAQPIRFPYLKDVHTCDIGLWGWTQPASTAGRQEPIQYLEHHVFPEHFQKRWIGANFKDGECQIGAIWAEDRTGSVGLLLGTYGWYAGNINAQLTDEQATERIWSFLEAQAGMMDLLTKVGKAECSGGALGRMKAAFRKSRSSRG